MEDISEDDVANRRSKGTLNGGKDKEGSLKKKLASVLNQKLRNELRVRGIL